MRIVRGALQPALGLALILHGLGTAVYPMRGIDAAYERYRLYSRTKSPFHRKSRYMSPIVCLHPQDSAFAQKLKTKGWRPVPWDVAGKTVFERMIGFAPQRNRVGSLLVTAPMAGMAEPAVSRSCPYGQNQTQ